MTVRYYPGTTDPDLSARANAPTAQAAESMPAVLREQERIAFKDAHRHLELYEVPDAWGRPMFKHSHVEASWLGWIARASHGQAPAGAGAPTEQQILEAAFAPAQPAVEQRAAYAALPDEREAFESWLRSVWTASYGCPKFDSGKYVHGEAQRFWECWQARASHEQASSQAGEYPALVCDYCGALTPDPWHSSGMLHGKMSKHIHSCDACAARGVAKAQDTPAYSPSQSDL